MIRNIAVSGVTTLEEFKNVCIIVGDNDFDDVTQEEIDEAISDGDYILYDNGRDTDSFMFFWQIKTIPSCTHYTYKDFISKYVTSVVDALQSTRSEVAILKQERDVAAQTITNLTQEVKTLNDVIIYYASVQHYLENKGK